MKKYLCLIICILLFFLSCGNIKYDLNSIVIYLEYNGVLGEDNNIVKKKIEKKFEEDTGTPISLDVEVYSTGDISSKFSTAIDAGSNERLDGLIFHYSSDGPLNANILNGEAKDITEDIKLAPNYLKYYNNDQYDKGGKSYYSGIYNNKFYSFSSCGYTSQWGALVNKSMMLKTSFSPDEYDISNPNYKSMTVDDFLKLLREIKANNSDVTRAVHCASWEMDNIVAPAFGAVKYSQKVLDEQGNLIPSYASKEYLEYMKFLRILQGENLWTETPSSSSVDMRSAFLSGKCGVYMQWPEVTSQASIALELKKERDDDCILLAPLIAEGKNISNGNLRQESAFVGMILPNKAKNTKLLIKYMDWLYSSQENYELAKYGIEGKHWIKGEKDGISFWGYPNDKKEEYSSQKPYTGIYCLIENINLSNRIYDGYTEQQMKWINTVHNYQSFPKNGFVTEGMLLPDCTTTNNRELIQSAARINGDYSKMIKHAWGKENYIPNDYTELVQYWQTLHDNMIGKLADHSDAKNYNVIKFDTENYYNKLFQN